MNNPMIDFAQIENAIDRLVKSSINSESMPKEVRSTLEPFIGMALIDASLLEKYFDALVRSQNRLHLNSGKVKSAKVNGAPSLESIIKHGLPTLDDANFSNLALKPIGLRLLSDALNDKISEGSDEVGDEWWIQIQSLENSNEQTYSHEASKADVLVELNPSRITPVTKQRAYSNAWMTLALAAAILVGIGIGTFFSGIGSGSARELLVANATLENVKPRGNGVALEIKVISKHSGFATFVVVGPGKPRVFPDYGEDLQAIVPNVPLAYGPLEEDAGTIILSIITETPATDLLRRLASKGELTSKDPDRLKSIISESLWKANFRWIEFHSISVPKQ